jgi:hypothetical protein
MRLDAKSRAQAGVGRSLDLPPPFRAVALREAGDAFAHAIRIAGVEGAGTLVHVGRFDLAEFAVVMEPDEPLRSARRALYAGLAALADALAVHAPPEKSITFEWPETILIDGGLVGGARLGWPTDSQEDDVPDWLVFGAMVRTAIIDDQEPGRHPLAAALDEEGFCDLGPGRLVETFARHLMVAIDAWQQDGFETPARNYLLRLAAEPGTRKAIDLNGDLLLLDSDGHVQGRQALLSALQTPRWLDPATGVPRL